MKPPTRFYQLSSFELGLELIRDCCNAGTVFTFLQDTLNSPVYEEGSWTVSDIVEPAVMAVLQDPHEEESAQPAGRTRLTSTHINQGIIH